MKNYNNVDTKERYFIPYFNLELNRGQEHVYRISSDDPGPQINAAF